MYMPSSFLPHSIAAIDFIHSPKIQMTKGTVYRGLCTYNKRNLIKNLSFM